MYFLDNLLKDVKHSTGVLEERLPSRVSEYPNRNPTLEETVGSNFP
jgi:hypothetical protein